MRARFLLLTAASLVLGTGVALFALPTATAAALLVGAAASFLASIVILLIAPTLLVPPALPALLETAQRLSRGDLGARSPANVTAGPLAPIGEALERLAAGRARSMEELRAERDLVGRILERMDEGVMLLDDQRRVLLVNGALRQMLLPDASSSAPSVPGLDEGTRSLLDPRGRTLLEVSRHPELDALVDRAGQPGGTGRATGELETSGLRPRRLLVRVVRLDTSPPGFLLVILDVTEMRRLETLRRDFVANASHELRTPVATLRSAAETMRDARDPAVVARLVDIIERNAERLQNLVEDLLDLARIESRAFRLQIEELDVPQLISYVLDLFRERAESRQVKLRTDLAEKLPPLPTDRRALEQILSNLVDNAVKYGREGGSVVVRARTDGKHLVFAIEDTGPGIDAHHLPRIFERFYRVDPGRARDRGGTGLGLSIVKHLSEALGGDVAVESIFNAGCTFTVTLPLQPPSESEAFA